MSLHIAPLAPHELPGHLPGALLARVRWYLHTPFATVLAAWHGDRLAGLATAWRLHEAACITTLYVQPDDPAVFAALAEALLAALVPDDAPCVVHATPAQRAQWSALGFMEQHTLLRLTGVRFTAPQRGAVVALEPQHWLAVFRLDRLATGLDRRALLLEHGYLGQVYEEGGRVRGFYLPLLGHGLIVADAPHVGLELQHWLHPVQGHVLLPATSPALEELSTQAKAVSTEALCLVRGTLSPQAEMLYAEPYGAADGPWPEED